MNRDIIDVAEPGSHACMDQVDQSFVRGALRHRLLLGDKKDDTLRIYARVHVVQCIGDHGVLRGVRRRVV
jgi:hypothetical protein